MIAQLMAMIAALREEEAYYLAQIDQVGGDLNLPPTNQQAGWYGRLFETQRIRRPLEEALGYAQLRSLDCTYEPPDFAAHDCGVGTAENLTRKAGG